MYSTRLPLDDADGNPDFRAKGGPAAEVEMLVALRSITSRYLLQSVVRLDD